MANDIIDINVYETTETVAITVNPNLTTVNINQITSSSGGANLTTSQTASNFTINSNTGTDAIVPLGNGTLAGATLNDYTTDEKNKLSGIETGAEVNVNADWDAVSGDAQILNKPTIPADSPITIVNDNSLFSTGLIDTGENSTATNSIFLGDGAGYGTTTANNSNFIGASTGYNASYANDSNFIGTGAGIGASSANNSNFFGKEAGSNASGANNSNLLGYQAGMSFTDNDISSNNIIIGTNISLPNGTDNSINLGGVLFGTGTHSDISGDPSITPISGGRIGIGVVSPTNTLHIYSEAANTSGLRLERLTSASPSSTGKLIGVDSSGNVVTLEGAGGGGSSVNYYLNGGTSQGNIGGTTYYEFSKTAVIGTGADFNISSNGYIASFITDVADPSLLLIPAGNWNLEFFFSSSSAGGSPSFYAELYKYDGTTFTLIASGSAAPEGITNGTAIDAYFTPLAVPETVLTVNDRLAIRVYVNASSKTITLHTQNGHLCEVITTFTAGLTALNGLQAQVQNFATGTTGTDFAINSSGSTHTFNLPTASASNRGALSSANWTTFNNKQDTLTAGNGIDITTNTISTVDTSRAAYTMLANNTNASEIPTTQVYKDIAEQTYSGSPTWSGTAPTTILANTYKWNQVGSLVTVRLSLSYNVGGSNATVIIPLPTDLPTPAPPTGFTGALDVLYYGVGMFNTSTVAVGNTSRVCFLRRNSANNGYEFLLTAGTAISIKVVHLTLQYFT